MQKELSEESYKQFSSFLKLKIGITLGDNKQYLVRSRLSSISRDFNYDSLDKMISAILQDNNQALVDRALFAMTTNETFWFRDLYPFDILSNHLLPELAQQKNKIRIWSAACSYGQEPYSIAMIISEFNNKYPTKRFNQVEIIATDVTNPVLERAALAEYDELAVSRGLSKERLNNFFTQNSVKKWTLNSDIKKLVQFRKLNLFDSFSSIGQCDLVFCRNVLIYFDDKDKAKILQKISAQLPANGSLFLGAAESIAGAEHLFKMVKQSQGLYYSKL
ncbi:CheR family methyltransferase [Glaciecola sp. 1036]|uniref:CheR family methyltransferase n=1 Tax=Alteromonadaceae TaxID=72275 RepID=UPI003CFD6F04